MRFASAALGAALATVAATAAQAQDPAFITLGGGYFDVVRGDNPAADFRLEYRSDLELWVVKPWAGVEATSDGAFYLAGGLLADIYFGNRIVVTPQAGLGYYNNGDGPDLGYPLEFRTGVEVGYRFDNRSRLAVGFSHISNADLGDSNPGTEILTLTYSIPVDRLFGDQE
ncbi:MAG: acyloxyacyl hydrolase [Alphaproteobacteria bacterium]